MVLPNQTAKPNPPDSPRCVCVELSLPMAPFFNFLTCYSQRPANQSGLCTSTLHLTLLNDDDAKEELLQKHAADPLSCF